VHSRPEVQSICEQHMFRLTNKQHIQHTVRNIASLKVLVSNGKRPELESLQVPCHSVTGILAVSIYFRYSVENFRTVLAPGFIYHSCLQFWELRRNSAQQNHQTM
jgi:hypothetical protein